MNVELLAAHAEPVIRGVSAKSVDNYCRLMRWYGERNVADDVAFQRLFAYFYRMTRLGLTGEFKHRYFEILESSRGALQVDVEAVVRELYGIPTSRGRRALQYSFVTKLAHTANPSYPIYDALVRVSSGSDRRTTARLRRACEGCATSTLSSRTRTLSGHPALECSRSSTISTGLTEQTVLSCQIPRSSTFLCGRLAASQRCVPNSSLEPSRLVRPWHRRDDFPWLAGRLRSMPLGVRCCEISQ